MYYYSYYTNWKRSESDLLYRTEDGSSPQKEKLLMFTTKEAAEKDFMAILWDNEGFVINEYVDTDGGVKAAKPAKVRLDRAYTDVKKNFVYNEDCIKTMSRMPKGCVDMCITSPPYNVGKRTSFGKNNAIYKGKEEMYNDYVDEMTDEAYELWIFKVIDELIRVTRNHVFFNIQMLGRNKRTILRLFGKYANNIKDIIIWDKKIAPPNIQPGVMNSGFEFIIIFSNQSPEQKKFEDGNFKGNFRNVIHGINATSNEHKDINKATFPLYLPRTLLVKFGKPGELIYDPFSGTGTTAQACVMEDRDFIGSELDPEQCEITNVRILNERNKLKLL